ncbi:MAG: crosslink repair DNA glycosylase YcaQ family protein, partial [Roseiarcus sp.]
MEKLSPAEARRIALAAQGFGGPRPEKVTAARWLRTIDRLSLHQIDSVNVLVRAHYLPAFSRLGPYDRSLIDTAAWGGRKQRRLFEYWAHEASLLPLALHPLLRWRMARAERGEAGWKGLRLFARERRAEAEALLERIRAEGPSAASDLEEKRGRSGWWQWGDAKQALEWLFWTGRITTATRRGSFERVYDLSERVIPAEIRALPTPNEKEAQRALIERAARALGVATEAELRDYFRLGPHEA